jgi:hypothetical protein
LTLSRETWAAIEADLLRIGFTMADLGEKVSWRAVAAFVKHSGQDSAVYQEANGADSAWTLETQLLALIADVLQIGNWQRGGGQSKRPVQLPRPGVQAPEKASTWGDDALTVEAFDEWWGR